MGEYMNLDARRRPPPRWKAPTQEGVSTLTKAAIVAGAGLGVGLLYVLSPAVNLANKVVGHADDAIVAGKDAFANKFWDTAEEKRAALEHGWTIGDRALSVGEWKRLGKAKEEWDWKKWMFGGGEVNEAAARVTRAHGIGMWLGSHGLADETRGHGRWAEAYDAIGRLVDDGMNRGSVLRYTDVVYGYTAGTGIAECAGLDGGKYEWDSVVLRHALLWKVCVQATALKVARIAGRGDGAGYDRMTDVQRGLMWLYGRIAVPGMATAIAGFRHEAPVTGYALESGVARVMIGTLSAYYKLGDASGIHGVREVIGLLVERNGAAGAVLMGLDAAVSGYETVMGLGELVAGGLVPRDWVYAMLVMLRHGYAGSIDEASGGISEIGPLLTNATAVEHAIKRAQERVGGVVLMPEEPVSVPAAGAVSRGEAEFLNMHHTQAQEKGAVRVYDLGQNVKVKALLRDVDRLAATDGRKMRVVDGTAVRALGWRDMNIAIREFGIGMPVRYESFDDLVAVQLEGRLGKKYARDAPMKRDRCVQGVWPSEPLTWAELRLWIALNDVPMYIERVGESHYQIRGTMWDSHIFTVRTRLLAAGVAMPEIWIMFLTGEYVGLGSLNDIYLLYRFMAKAFPVQAPMLLEGRGMTGLLAVGLVGITDATGNLARTVLNGVGVGDAVLGPVPPMGRLAVQSTTTPTPTPTMAQLLSADETPVLAEDVDVDVDDQADTVEIDVDPTPTQTNETVPLAPTPQDEPASTNETARVPVDPTPTQTNETVPVAPTRDEPASTTPTRAILPEGPAPTNETRTAAAAPVVNATLTVPATTRGEPTTTNETRTAAAPTQAPVVNATRPTETVPPPRTPTREETPAAPRSTQATAQKKLASPPRAPTQAPVVASIQEETTRTVVREGPTRKTYAPLAPDLDDSLSMYLDALLPQFIIGDYVGRMRTYVSMVPDVCWYTYGEGMFATRMHRCEGVDMGNGTYRYALKEGA